MIAVPKTAEFPPLKQIDAGALTVGYAEVGPTGGKPVLLFHGWPYDIHSYVDVAPLLATKGYRVIVPYVRGYGTTRFLSPGTTRSGQQGTIALDAIAFMDALKIPKAIIGGFDWGARTGNIIAALWPERCKGLVSVSGYLIGSQAAGRNPLLPRAEYQWWYQYYFATERGRLGYQENTHEFNKLIWQLASPRWNFDDAIYDRSAAAFDNESKLAQAPDIAVPTVTLEGDANGAPHPEAAVYAKKFTGKYKHWVIEGGVGHNLPQEAPQAFADAIIEVDRD